MEKSGLSLEAILLALFIFCKVAGITAIANWPWLWVLSPAWIGIALLLAFILICLLFTTIVQYIDKGQKEQKKTTTVYKFKK